MVVVAVMVEMVMAMLAMVLVGRRRRVASGGDVGGGVHAHTRPANLGRALAPRKLPTPGGLRALPSAHSAVAAGRLLRGWGGGAVHG